MPVSDDRSEPTGQTLGVDPVWRALDSQSCGLVLLRPVRDVASELVDFTCVAANAAAERILGRTRDVLIGRRVSEGAELGAAWIARCAEVLRSGVPYAFEEAPLGRADRSAISGVAVRTSDGVAVRFDDASARARAEAELRRGRTRAELVARFAPVDVFEADLEGGVAECSGGLLAGLVGSGASPTLPLARWREHVASADVARFEEALAGLAQGDAREFALEVAVRAPGGGARWCLLRGELERAADGRPLRARGVVSDIDARRRAELAERDAKERAELASLAKSQFFAGMSHEIRTPMSGILGLCEILQPFCPEGQAQEYLGMIHACASGLLGLLGDVLDLAKIEAGRLDLLPGPFSLRGALAELLRPLEVLAQTKGLALDAEVDAAVADGFVADFGRIRQVLVNLVGNAIKFTERGSIRVIVRSGGALPSPGAELLHISVEDTGVGIPADRRARIFQSFEQSAPVPRQQPGVGLGLSIAARLVDRLGGRIWFESEEALGSTFHFTARVERLPDAVIAAVTADTPRTPSRALRVLLVEDEPISQVVTAHQLERFGHEVVVVDNGWRALAALAAGGFDAVLMDLEMPELDGVETLQMLRASADTPRVPVVALTARAAEGDRERCLQIGFDGYLCKPVDARALADALARAAP